jgi:dihydroorotase-like cyclic amidohydrolase
MKQKKKLSDEGLYTKVGWSPYSGRTVKGIPTMTLLRGRLIMKDGEVFAKRGTGKFTPRLAS